ncbi:unnamed protein product [Peniophora sp. CBMAI 1063]|nr:unnamed protein product [Peniophora sp. CBMAI 1063]
MSEPVDVFPILALPVELILEIKIWAQYIWVNDQFTPSSGTPTRRQAAGPSEIMIRQDECCSRVNPAVLPSCVKTAFSRHVLSPAHCLSQTCHFLLDVVRGGDSRTWESDNALLHFKADDAGIARHSSIKNVAYQSQTLIASPTCTCPLNRIRAFYDSLKDVKLSLPWATPTHPYNNDVFTRNHIVTSPLERFDLEYLDPPRAADIPSPSMRFVRSNSVTFSRTIHAPFFYSSTAMTSLCIRYTIAEPSFGQSFWSGLALCSESLEYLTLDAPSTMYIGGENFIQLRRLRYIRLVSPAAECAWLLQALQLPADVDIHLEPVYDWRWAAEQAVNVLLDSGHAWPLEVPFTAMEDAADADTDLRPHGHWRFMAALAAPDQTSSIFHTPPLIHIRPENLSDKMRVVALDVRLDPSTNSAERACSRFPEIVGVAFASTLQELLDRGAAIEPDW